MKPKKPEVSVDEIEDIIMMSSASQIFLSRYSADEVNRAIEDMKDLAQAIHKRINGGDDGGEAQ